MLSDLQQTQKIELLRERMGKFATDENTLKVALIKNGWDVERAFKYCAKMSSLGNFGNIKKKHRKDK